MDHGLMMLDRGNSARMINRRDPAVAEQYTLYVRPEATKEMA
jgi:hypothetical protein